MNAETPFQDGRKKQNHTGGRTFGLLIIIIGIGILLRRMDIPEIPHWLLQWPMIVILLGIFSGIKSKFKSSAPFFIIAFGVIALLYKMDVIPHDSKLYIGPLFIIAAGLYLVFKPKKKCDPEMFIYSPEGKNTIVDETLNNELLDVTAVFCGTKKNILNKNFKGGEITAIFGGTELNLIQADIPQRAVIDVTIIFGGLKIIVPNNWDVRTNLVNVAAGVEDKRQVQTIANVPEKTLVIEGTLLFGGIEISNY